MEGGREEGHGEDPPINITEHLLWAVCTVSGDLGLIFKSHNKPAMWASLPPFIKKKSFERDDMTLYSSRRGFKFSFL